jgi:hypothetical protein
VQVPVLQRQVVLFCKKEPKNSFDFKVWHSAARPKEPGQKIFASFSKKKPLPGFPNSLQARH